MQFTLILQDAVYTPLVCYEAEQMDAKIKEAHQISLNISNNRNSFHVKCSSNV